MQFIIKVVAAMAFFFSLQPSFAQTENIKKSTKDAVEALRREFPKFKLSPEAQECLDDSLKGKSVDPECDPAINDEVQVYRERQQLDAKNQQLDAKNQQLDIISKAGQHIDIAVGLIQLGMYVDYGKVPNPQADYIKKVQSSPSIPQEVQILFSTILQRHREKLPLPFDPYGKDLLALVAKNIDEAIKLQKQITDPKYKADTGEFINTVKKMLDDYRRLKEKSAPK
jgi:hypothetical protein